MKIDKVSEYILVDDNGNKVRIKNMNGSWHLVIDDLDGLHHLDNGTICAFSFDEDDARKFANLFDEINRSSSVSDLKIWKDIDKAIKDSKLDRHMKLKHDGEHLHY